jgi:hypothetical protein
LRFYNRYNKKKNRLPMKIFTPDNMMFSEKTNKPRKQTLDLIRLVAYTYHSNRNQTSNLN